MEFTIVSVIVFGSITMCLVLLLNLAEKKLLPQGDVSILINDESEFYNFLRKNLFIISVNF